MGYWSVCCVEGFCFGDSDEAGNYPCGRDVPSPDCLGDGENGICPHFSWSGVTERDAAKFPKLRLIIWDRLLIWNETVWDKLCWWFWDCLWFNRRKVREFFDNIPIADCPEWDKEQEQANQEFGKWFGKEG